MTGFSGTLGLTLAVSGSRLTVIRFSLSTSSCSTAFTIGPHRHLFWLQMVHNGSRMSACIFWGVEAPVVLSGICRPSHASRRTFDRILFSLFYWESSALSDFCLNNPILRWNNLTQAECRFVWLTFLTLKFTCIFRASGFLRYTEEKPRWVIRRVSAQTFSGLWHHWFVAGLFARYFFPCPSDCET